MMLTKILKSRLSKNNLGTHPVETCSLMVTVNLGNKEQTELECFLVITYNIRIVDSSKNFLPMVISSH